MKIGLLVKEGAKATVDVNSICPPCRFWKIMSTTKGKHLHYNPRWRDFSVNIIDDMEVLKAEGFEHSY